MPELFAFTYGQGLPMAWLNAGAYNRSVGLLPATPVPDQNTFRALVSPNAASTTNDFMKQADLNKAWAARAQRRLRGISASCAACCAGPWRASCCLP